MDTTLTAALAEVVTCLEKSDNFARLVLSGRRRNMQTPTERVDVKPVLIKGEVKYQLTQSDGRAMTTKNYAPTEFIALNLLESGFANILLEKKDGSISIRITKKGEALVHRTTDTFQVEEFLRLLVPSLDSAISAGHIAKPTAASPLSIVDLGCGHAYLTFAAHQYLIAQGVPVTVVGIDVRESARVRNNQIAEKLGISKSITFFAEEISQTTLKSADVVIALHACDTATDDAIAWAVGADAKLALIAPCCHHDIQAQMNEIPEPWQIISRNGIMKERLGDLITDALRMQIMKLLGYRVEAIEFIGGEHTPRNLMIRAVKTGAGADSAEKSRYDAMIALWKVKPALATLLNR